MFQDPTIGRIKIVYVVTEIKMIQPSEVRRLITSKLCHKIQPIRAEESRYIFVGIQILYWAYDQLSTLLKDVFWCIREYRYHLSLSFSLDAQSPNWCTCVGEEHTGDSRDTSIVHHAPRRRTA